MTRVPAVGLGLSDHGGSNRGGVPDQQGVAEALHQRVKPPSVPRAFDGHRGGWLQCRIEALHFTAIVTDPKLLIVVPSTATLCSRVCRSTLQASRPSPSSALLLSSRWGRLLRQRYQRAGGPFS